MNRVRLAFVLGVIVGIVFLGCLSSIFIGKDVVLSGIFLTVAGYIAGLVMKEKD